MIFVWGVRIRFLDANRGVLTGVWGLGNDFLLVNQNKAFYGLSVASETVFRLSLSRVFAVSRLVIMPEALLDTEI